jgi:phage gp29-like protein
MPTSPEGNPWVGETGRPTRRGTVIAPSVYNLQRQIIRYASDILFNSDVAYRSDRELQRQMRRDPQIMSPLLQRQYAVAQLPWSIVPEDEEDPIQVEQANQIENQIHRNLRQPTEFFRCLLEAVWGGASAVNIAYERTNKGMIVPTNWTPFHWDSLAFDDEGNPGLYVNQQYPGEKVVGTVGWVHPIRGAERDATVIHVFNRTAPDYEEPYDARFVYAGRGIRDIVWYFWLMMNTQLGLWTAYNERYGMGIREGRYPAGNVEAKAAMQAVLDNLVGDVSVVSPVDPNNPEAYGIKIHEPNTSSQSVYKEIIDEFLSGVIKELIIGQRATTEATSTGLGSSVGDQHAETFLRIVKADAKSLSDTLTFEMVHVMHRWNYGNTPYKPRLEFAIEDTDSADWLAGVERAYGMGLSIPARQVRQRLGIDEPKGREEVLDPAGGLGGLDSLFGAGAPGGAPPEGEPAPDSAPGDELDALTADEIGA